MGQGKQSLLVLGGVSVLPMNLAAMLLCPLVVGENLRDAMLLNCLFCAPYPILIHFSQDGGDYGPAGSGLAEGPWVGVSRSSGGGCREVVGGGDWEAAGVGWRSCY